MPNFSYCGAVTGHKTERLLIEYITMKDTFYFLVMTFLMMSCSQLHNYNTATIKGKVSSVETKEIKFERIVDNPIDRKGETFVAVIDSNSNFSIEIPIERIATGRISVGSFYHDICLIPGDDFIISIDADTIIYSGKGAEKK